VSRILVAWQRRRKIMKGLSRLFLIWCLVLACKAQLVLDDGDDSDEGQVQNERRIPTDPMTRMLQWGVENSDLSDFAQKAKLIREFSF
jgi:hypothetical protein